MRKGFTLVELLVTIGIIGLLAGIAIPTGIKALNASRLARMESDMRAIAVGIEAYRQDFGDYPRPDPANASSSRGAQTLCRSLLAPGPAGNPTNQAIAPGDDGADGLGFRIRRRVASHPSGAVDANGMPIMIFDNWLFQGKVYGPYVEKLSATATDGTGVIRSDVGGDVLYYIWNPRLKAFDPADNVSYMPNAPTGKGSFALVMSGRDKFFGTSDDVVVIQ